MLKNIETLTDNQRTQFENLTRVSYEELQAWLNNNNRGVHWVNVPPQQREFAQLVQRGVAEKIRENGNLLARIAAYDFAMFVSYKKRRVRRFESCVPAAKHASKQYLHDHVKFNRFSWRPKMDPLCDGTQARIGFFVRPDFWEVLQEHADDYLQQLIYSVRHKDDRTQAANNQDDMCVVGTRLIQALPSEERWGFVEVWLRDPRSHIEQRDRLLLEQQVKAGQRDPADLYTVPERKHRHKKNYEHKHKNRRMKPKQHREAPKSDVKAQNEEHKIRMTDEEARAKQTELRAEAVAEVEAASPEELASGPVTKLVEGLDRTVRKMGETTDNFVGTVGEAVGQKVCDGMTALAGGSPADKTSQTE